ncbi:hypothetical protein BG011_005359 [Mortierella polycephala]|uniref:Arrestin C-terminal-like domain-containing protein n=1 Tax=Mortierella polycephala TaxID=41804 RepID=A0A9P6QF25_9FUNG|nr:hypothetical protein BG011_005359 [Mortierella polycephala]
MQPKLPPILPPPGSVPGTGSGSGSGFVSGIEAAAASALTLANNIAFRPTTTQPAKCSKLKIRIYFDSTIFQAGGNLFGRMEIIATSSRSLKLGEIAVELAAYEGPSIPPSNAVHGPCDEDGFWMAKKGKTTFPFAFQLPLDCPSSLVFGQTASLRYVVTGLVQVFYHDKDETILKSKEAFVVEAWDGYNPDYRLPVKASNSTKLFWGGSGSLALEAKLSERLHSAGGNLTVEVKVKNNTSRKVQGVRLGVSRRLEMVSDKAKAEQNPGLKIETDSVSEVIGTQEFKSSSYLFDTGEERTMTINMIMPGNARTIRGTALFEVTCFVVVSMLLGAFSGELSVEIPVKICHPASLTPAPKPKLDQNHLPHHYNFVDENMDLELDTPTRFNRRVGSNASLVPPIASGNDANGNNHPSTKGRDLPWGPDGNERQDEVIGIGRQGDWDQDAHELSPANSITSIRSILSSPKQKLSKLADKIQRSTSPSSSSHFQHENRHGSKHSDDPNAQGRRPMIAKSPPLGPAMPIAYVPAVERVRYTPFQPPPTTKAKEFLQAAALYQQEMAIGGALSGLGDENVEFDLGDKTMASAIHQWISKKESEGRYQNPSVIRAPTATRPTHPIQIPIASSSRRRPQVGPINTHIGSFSSQHSPTAASPQSYYSPTSAGDGHGFPSSPGASYSNQTTSRFLHHPHRQPAAPQTEAFGSAPEDFIATSPLFARPLPLPSPPPTGSPQRPGPMKPPVQQRPLSPVPIPVQTPESLAMAREAFERVKRVGSPVQDPILNAAVASSPSNSAPKTGFVVPPRPSSLESGPNIKVPIPLQSTHSNIATSPSGISRLLNDDIAVAAHPTQAIDNQAMRSTSPSPGSGIDLSRVPMNRPLPIPAPKPRHLNQSNQLAGMDFNAASRGVESKTRSIPAARPTNALSSGHTRIPQSDDISTSSPRNDSSTRSGHLGGRESEGQRKGTSNQQNNYIPKPTPVPSARPPPLAAKVVSNNRDSTQNKPSVTKNRGIASGSLRPSDGLISAQDTGSGFVYPKATRKPVPGAKPTVATKPKGLSSQPPSTTAEVTTASPHKHAGAAAAESRSHSALDQRLGRPHPQRQAEERALKREKPLAQTASMRAPQVIVGPIVSSSRTAANGPRFTSIRASQTARVVAASQEEASMAPVVEEPEDPEKVVSQEHSQPSDDPDASAAGVEFHVPEPTVETQSEIRAQAIAAANSFRATGANSGGYVVNTGKLRLAIRDNNGDGPNSGGGNSGHLIQALADGAINAASAAASGLGWRQQSSQSSLTDSQTSQPQQQKYRQQTPPGSKNKVAPLHRNSPRPVEQIHDLTMKDIHFQTLAPSNHSGYVFDPPTMSTANTIMVHNNTHSDSERTRSHHLAPSTAAKPLATSQQQSRSQPMSRVMDMSTKEEPLPPMPTPIVVEAYPTPQSATGKTGSANADEIAIETETEIAPPNLDKTLPKIHEPTPRSRVFERPEQNDEIKKRSNAAPTPKAIGSPFNAKPKMGSRYGQGVGTDTGAGARIGATLVPAPAPKVINPKLQEYIQKYNLAVNTR